MNRDGAGAPRPSPSPPLPLSRRDGVGLRAAAVTRARRRCSSQLREQGHTRPSISPPPRRRGPRGRRCGCRRTERCPLTRLARSLASTGTVARRECAARALPNTSQLPPSQPTVTLPPRMRAPSHDRISFPTGAARRLRLQIAGGRRPRDRARLGQREQHILCRPRKAVTVTVRAANKPRAVARNPSSALPSLAALASRANTIVSQSSFGVVGDLRDEQAENISLLAFRLVTLAGALRGAFRAARSGLRLQLTSGRDARGRQSEVTRARMSSHRQLPSNTPCRGRAPIQQFCGSPRTKTLVTIAVARDDSSSRVSLRSSPGRECRGRRATRESRACDRAFARRERLTRRRCRRARADDRLLAFVDPTAIALKTLPRGRGASRRSSAPPLAKTGSGLARRHAVQITPSGAAARSRARPDHARSRALALRRTTVQVGGRCPTTQSSMGGADAVPRPTVSSFATDRRDAGQPRRGTSARQWRSGGSSSTKPARRWYRSSRKRPSRIAARNPHWSHR